MRRSREKQSWRKAQGPESVPLYCSPGSFTFAVVIDPGQAAFWGQTLPTPAFSLKFLQEGMSSPAL